MSSDIAEQAEVLARALEDDRLVALVGSGASARHKDGSGRVYEGLPTPAEFVRMAARQFPYVREDMPFNTACDEILGRERRAGLEDFLLRYYRVPETQEIPPAHRILAWLPFSLYITSNYDQFLERALERENRKAYSIIDNEDLIRLKRWHTPVIKYHGCVSRPNTMVAATRDYAHLEEHRALVAKLVAVSLAGKTLLVIGHGLSDSDLSKLINDVLSNLAGYGPNIVVVREPGKSARLTHVNYEVEVVSEDLTTFLNRLLHSYRALKQTVTGPAFSEQWLDSSFFAELKQAATLPTETQVIDAFLKHLHAECYARDDVEGVVSDARIAIAATLDERPNYGALRKTWDELSATLESLKTAPDAEEAVEDFIASRTSLIGSFTKLGRGLVRPNDRILLFSQSQRVLQALKGANVNTQRTCHIFIAECRPKSPQSYQDAEATCKELAETYYRVTVCPDVVAINLINSQQIDKVIMGTHALYFDDTANPVASVHSYVNTCGSLAIELACRERGTPVHIIGETLKLEKVAIEERDDHLHPHEENDLRQMAVGLRELRTKKADVGHLNIGYDLVEIHENTTIHVPDLTTALDT